MEGPDQECKLHLLLLAVKQMRGLKNHARRQVIFWWLIADTIIICKLSYLAIHKLVYKLLFWVCSQLICTCLYHFQAFSSLENKFCTKEVKKIQMQRKTTVVPLSFAKVLGYLGLTELYILNYYYFISNVLLLLYDHFLYNIWYLFYHSCTKYRAIYIFKISFLICAGKNRE